MSVIANFVRWWNALAVKNGKMKFRNQREAADFVRRVQNQNGGPNAKIIALRRAYEEANRSKARQQTQSGGRGGSAILR